jgi:hypothetical protein
MPIGDFEREVLRAIAANRNPDSFLGRATVLHQTSDSPRPSRDVALFHDTTESLAQCSDRDLTSLRASGFEVELEKTEDTFRRTFVKRGPQQTKIEWVFDSAFRFFPVEPDLELGWRLNFWDAATNKVLALVGRAEVRDYLDCIYLHRRHLALGALAWAAAGKDPGYTPETLVDWARRGTKYRPEDLADLRLSQPVDLRAVKQIWLQACAEAETLFDQLPPAEMGCFYLDPQGKPVCPNPASCDFSKLTRHFGSVKGAWPRIAERQS